MTQYDNVAVIGGSGRLGSYVVEAVAESQPRVTVIDLRAPTDDSHTYVEADVNDLASLMRALRDCDAIILTAAIPNPRSAPEEVTFSTNVLGTWNVFKAAKELGIKRLIVTSSDAITGLHYNPSDWRPQYIPVDEQHSNRPSEVYSLSKEVTESICRSFAHESQMAVTALRPAHIVFPPEYPELRERGSDPTNYHLWTYVDPSDVAQAFSLAMESNPRPGSYEAYFVAAADTLSDEPTLDIARNRWTGVRINDDDWFQENPNASVFSSKKAQRDLGYRPMKTWRDMIVKG